MSSSSESDSRSDDVEGELRIADRRQKELSRGSDMKTTASDAQTGNQVIVIASDPVMSSARLDWLPETAGASTGRGNSTLTGVGPRPCRSGGGQAAILENMDLFDGHDSLRPWTQTPNGLSYRRRTAHHKWRPTWGDYFYFRSAGYVVLVRPRSRTS